MANAGLEQVVGFHAFAEDLGYFRRLLKALWLGMRTAALRDFCFQTRLTNRLTYLLTFFYMVLAHISILGSGYYDPHVSQSLSILSCCIHKMSSSKARNLSIFFESSCMLTKEQTNKRDSKHNTLATDELKIDDGGDR